MTWAPNRRMLVGLGIAIVVIAGVVAVGTRGDEGWPTPSDLGSIPNDIAADCSRNVEAELSRHINGLPDGSTVRFADGGCYAQGGRIEVRDKRRLTLDGRGSTFKSSAPNSALAANPNWLILRGRGVRLRNMKIIGNFHLTGARSQKRVAEVTIAGAGNQFNMGVGIYGGDGNHVTDTTISDVFGDGVSVNVAHYIDGPKTQPLDTPRNVHVERVKVHKAARHCFSPSQSIGFWLEDSEASDCWYGGLDIELDDVTQKLQGIHVLRNTFRGFIQFGVEVPVAGNGSNVRDIEIRDNTFSTAPDASCRPVIEVGYQPATANTFKNIVITGNTMKAHGLAIALDHVAGATVRHNAIDISEKGCGFAPGSSPLRVLNSTDVKVEDNSVRRTAPAAGATGG